jgi:hypothetical protein
MGNDRFEIVRLSRCVSGKGVDMGCYELFVPSGLFISFK